MIDLIRDIFGILRVRYKNTSPTKASVAITNMTSFDNYKELCIKGLDHYKQQVRYYSNYVRYPDPILPADNIRFCKNQLREMIIMREYGKAFQKQL